MQNLSSGSPESRAPHPAETHALRVAQEAAARVPAYGRFLRLAGYDASRLRSFADFCQLPIMDKASYLNRYPVEQRCLDGDLARASQVTLSSGSSGRPTLWPRFAEQGMATVAAMAMMLQQHFRLRERWTLLVVAPAVGPWGFGTTLAQAGQELFSRLGFRGTVVIPGLDQDDVLRFVEQLSPQYDQTILVSYSGVLPDLLAAGQRRGVDWPALNVGCLAAGEYLSEPQRELILQYIGKDPERLEGCFSAFGASEVAGVTGYETHLCLLLRRLCVQTPALAEALFGSPVIPALNQYNPQVHFHQVAGDDLLLTMRAAVPLVRYNTHDRGGLLTLAQVEERCRAHEYDLLAELRARGFGPQQYRALPFMYAFGRGDCVILHGANVYVDQVAYALDKEVLRGTSTGNFELGADLEPDGRETLRVAVELRSGIEASEGLRAQCQQGLIEGLHSVNSLFRTVHGASHGTITVDVALLPHGAFGPVAAKRHQTLRRAEVHPSPDTPEAGRRDGA